MEEQVKMWLSIRNNQNAVAEITNAMPQIMEETKSREWAEILRNNGNQSYIFCKTKQDFQRAYEFYSRSIAVAPVNSVEMALAYSNLSLVLLQLEKHSECLQAIDCCLNLDYPEGSKFKLYLRKIECLKILDEGKKAKEVFEQTLAWIKTKEQKEEMKTKLMDCYKKEVRIKKPFTNEEINQIWKNYSIKTFNEEIPGASDVLNRSLDRLEYEESRGRHYVVKRNKSWWDIN